jgi:hypothetical protein
VGVPCAACAERSRRVDYHHFDPDGLSGQKDLVSSLCERTAHASSRTRDQHWFGRQQNDSPGAHRFTCIRPHGKGVPRACGHEYR